MPLHARRYLDRAGVRETQPARTVTVISLQSRYIARACKIGKALPRVIDTLFLCLAALGLIGFFMHEELSRWIDFSDQNRADRAATSGCALLLSVVAGYLVWIVWTASATGAIERSLR
jgi:hypothetical protein